jgi:hypothetical protein
MYGAATFRMLAAIELDDLDWLPKLTLAIALLAWIVTSAGLVHEGVMRATRAPRAARPAVEQSSR